MKIDINAFMDSLPIMGVGLLGIFIVTIVLIIGIYILKAITSKIDKEAAEDEYEDDNDEDYDPDKDEMKAETKKESAMDLMKERKKKDFLKEEESYYISHDL